MFKEIGAFIDTVGSTVGTTIRRALNDEFTGPEGYLDDEDDELSDGLSDKLPWDKVNKIKVKIDSEDGDEDNDRDWRIVETNSED